MECIAIIGLAVGAERFTQDASQVMDMLLKRQTNCETTHEDPEQLPYLISAWARICKILGKAFRPYLPLVMEPVLRAARVKPEVFLVKSGHVKSNQSHGAWHYISLNGKQNFGINTSQFEDKANACQMLVCYARELKEAFCDYTEHVVRLMVPLLTFYFHDGVRIAAVESLPYLIECAKGRGAQHVQGLWSYMCPNVLKAIGNEPEKEVLAELLASLAKCIEQLGGASLTDELLNELMKTLGRLLTSHLDSADERRRKLEGDDCDEIVREQLVDSDEEDARIMSKIIQVIHALLVGYRSFFIPTFDCLIPHVMRLLGADRSWQDQRWAVCIFNELIEFTGEASVKYHEIFIKPLYDFLEHESLELRQAAAYGWGVLAMHGTGVFSIACHQAVPGLIEIITAPGSRCEANACVTESAISAVTKILKYSSSYVVVNEILPLWITWLPVWNDGNEAICVYEYLCDLVEGRHPVVLGPNHVKVPPIVSVIAEAFYKDVPKRDSPVYRRMLNIVSWVQRDLGDLEACLAALAPYHREALQRALIG